MKLLSILVLTAVAGCSPVLDYETYERAAKYCKDNGLGVYEVAVLKTNAVTEVRCVLPSGAKVDVPKSVLHPL